MRLKCWPCNTEKRNDCFTDKDIKKVLMKGRPPFHFFNPKLIISTLVLHAQGNDGSSLPWEVSMLLSPLTSLCLFLTQITLNWVRTTNTPPMTPHRHEVQPNWTDLSDWGCGARRPIHIPPLPPWSVTEESRGQHAQRKGQRLLLKQKHSLTKELSLPRLADMEREKVWQYANLCALKWWALAPKTKKQPAFHPYPKQHPSSGIKAWSTAAFSDAKSF